MIVKHSFKLPEEHEEYDIYKNSMHHYRVIDEFREWLRQRYKHTQPPNSHAEQEHEETAQAFYEIYNDES